MDFFESSDREVFILRVWKSKENKASLRGHIQHVGSGKTYPIRDPESILALIQKQVEIARKTTTPSGIK